ncbi:hypothetical protein QA802_12985 [Streptomyces sp. B21-105]|uniref:hypothetical protein n=1 Tax=Streptomyces sp. B21-105 TaxID=3039417 RepID=UPI002FEF2E50
MEAVDISHETLAALFEEAEPEVAIAAGALCLYRITPLLPWDGREHPQWELIEAEWSDLRVLPQQIDEVIRRLRQALRVEPTETADESLEELHEMASEAVLRYTDVDSLDCVEWADWCSTLALDIHQQLDELLDMSGREVGAQFFPAGTEPELTHLQALELEDQIYILRDLSMNGSQRIRKVIQRAIDGQLRVVEAFSRLA